MDRLRLGYVGPPKLHAEAELAARGWWQPQPGQILSRRDGREGLDGQDRKGFLAFLPLRPVPPVESAASPLAFRAVVAFTVILLLSPQIYFPILGTLRIAFVAAGLAIAAHVTHRLTRSEAGAPLAAEVRIAILLVAWAVMTLPISLWPGGSLQTLTEHYLKAIAFFWLIGTLAVTWPRVRTLTWTLVLCSIPLAATAVNNYLTGMFLSTGVPGLRRIYGYHGGSGIVGNPNDLALMLNLIIPITGAWILNARRPLERLVAVGALILSAIAVVLTFSRAGFLTLAATFLTFVVILIRRGAPGKAVLLLTAGLVVLPLLPTGYADRLSTITDIEADRTGSAEGRWRDFQVAIKLVQRNPIVGVGIGQDILALNETRGDDWTSIHNAFLQYAVDLGLPGLVLFVSLYLMCLRRARRVERDAARSPESGDLANLAAGVQASLVAFGIAAFFHPIAYQFYFFSIGGLAVALERAHLNYRAGEAGGTGGAGRRCLPAVPADPALPAGLVP